MKSLTDELSNIGMTTVEVTLRVYVSFTKATQSMLIWIRYT
jgi:hypothetical protein